MQAILEEERQKQLESNMSLLIQRVFRGWKSRRDFEYQLQVEWATPIIKRIMRRAPYVMRSYHPHIFVLTLRSASGVNVSGSKTSSPYAIVGAYDDLSKMKSSKKYLFIYLFIFTNILKNLYNL